MNNQSNSNCYKIVVCESSSVSKGVKSIVETVNQLYSSGWKTQGGISTMRTGPDSYKFFQAMIKEQ